MVKSAIVQLEVKKPILEDLESGTYRYVCHGSRSEFKNIEELKDKIKQQWELEEGLTVLSIDIVQVRAGEKPSTENEDGLKAISQQLQKTTQT